MKHTILIVDDNQEIIEFLQDLLSSDYSILTANNGEAGIELLKNEIVHLVISDIMMPVMDGFSLCEKIKADFELSHIPLILLTAKTMLQSKVQGLEMGADVYIEKPFSPRYLIAQVSSLLNNRLKLKEYFVTSPLAHIKSMAHTKTDEIFLDKLNMFINENLDNPELDVIHLANHLHMSRPTMYRKISAVTNLSPKELINITRLKRAAMLLLESDNRISDIVISVGFNSQSYFSQKFFKQFGISPLEYKQNKDLEKKNN